MISLFIDHDSISETFEVPSVQSSLNSVSHCLRIRGSFGIGYCEIFLDRLDLLFYCSGM